MTDPILNTQCGHALHPNPSKRTADILFSQEVLEYAQSMASAVSKLTSSPALRPVCAIVHALVSNFAICDDGDIITHFKTVDPFMDWMRTQEQAASQFKTLKPAFQKYLKDSGMQQLKRQRSFLDSRNINEKHRELVVLLANTGEAKDETAWYNITDLLEIRCEKDLRSESPSSVYKRLGRCAKDILKRTGFTAIKVSKRLLELGIGTPSDALYSGAQPVGLLSEAQNVLARNFVTVMQAATDGGDLATHYAHNKFIHILLSNPTIDSEGAITRTGFANTNLAFTTITEDVVAKIVNAYRKRAGLSPIEKTLEVSSTTPSLPKRAMVSSFGRFKSTQGVIGYPTVCKDGYVVVRIETKLYRMHRVVAFAFDIPRQPGQTQVNHKDRVPSHNWVANLEFVNQSQNILHSYSTNEERAKCSERMRKPVLGRHIGDIAWVSYRGVKDASSKCNVPSGCVTACAQGKQKQTGGYEFQFVTQPALDGEQWREVHGINVSNFGRHRNAFGVLSTPKPRANGYCSVGRGSKHSGNFRTFLVHRLVAEAFLPKSSTHHNEVNHKDGNPSNNAVDNLEWVTRTENMQHSFQTNAKRKSNAPRMAKMLRGRVKGQDEWTDYASAMEASRILKIPQGNISSCARGKMHLAHGYEFEFKVPEEPELLEGEEWREVDEAVLHLLVPSV